MSAGEAFYTSVVVVFLTPLGWIGMFVFGFVVTEIIKAFK